MDTRKVDIETLGLNEDWYCDGYYIDLIKIVKERFNAEIEAWCDSQPFATDGIAAINECKEVVTKDEILLFDEITAREPDVTISDDYNDYHFWFRH